MLSFGDASPFIPRIKSSGVSVICQVHTLAQAREVLGQGADIIVAQGSEAGGHGAARPSRWFRRWWTRLRLPGATSRS
jgi:nitronate monooxygenase